MSQAWFRVKECAYHQGLFRKGDSLVVAVSGGPDSICLLDMLCQLSRPYRLKLVMAHVNYGLRGEDSRKDEQLVVKMAEKYQLPLFILRPKVNISKNVEENLRNIRYNFFESIRKKEGANAIAVAHQADDQVETFFLHLLRGSGLKGMAGMLPKNGKIIRPLIVFKRKEILDYLKFRKLKYRVDKSNFDVKFTRNQIRHGLMPYLRKNFGDSIDEIISNALYSVSHDMKFLEEITAGVSKKTSRGKIAVNEWLKLPEALKKRLILAKIKEIKGDLQSIGTKQVSEVEKILKSKKSKTHKLSFQGLNIERKNDKLIISQALNL